MRIIFFFPPFETETLYPKLVYLRLTFFTKYIPNSRLNLTGESLDTHEQGLVLLVGGARNP